MSIYFVLQDLIEDLDLLQHDDEFCQSSQVSACVVTWNAGAAVPERTESFFGDLVRDLEEPDLLIFGFQELVDLEDKKLTASKSLPLIFSANGPELFFKGSAKKEYDSMHSVYRMWRTYLTSAITSGYQLLQSADLVGLFSCIFVKKSLAGRIHDVAIGELKRGMGGLHGNKVRTSTLRPCADDH